MALMSSQQREIVRDYPLVVLGEAAELYAPCAGERGVLLQGLRVSVLADTFTVDFSLTVGGRLVWRRVLVDHKLLNQCSVCVGIRQMPCND
jgi:hypothetical protein